jgi:hypothetical protein
MDIVLCLHRPMALFSSLVVGGLSLSPEDGDNAFLQNNDNDL